MKQGAFCLVAAVATVWGPAGALASDQAGDSPMVPLMTLTGSMPVKADAASVTRIAANYRFINGHRYGSCQWEVGNIGAFRERLARQRPGVLLSQYRNGSYIEQNREEEAAEVEAGLPLAIAVWSGGLSLSETVDAQGGDLTFEVAGWIRARKGLLASYPLKASTTNETHSVDKERYVSWLRLDDELVRIDSVERLGEDRLRVKGRRGLWRTESAVHKAGTRALLPVYIGSVTRGADTALSGVPDNRSEQRGLRYAMQVQHPEFHVWLAGKCGPLFEAGFDVVWLDVTSGTMYNQADAYGRRVTQWDLEHNRQMNEVTYRRYQQRKLDALFEHFPQGKFWVNNVKTQGYFGEAGSRHLLSGSKGHQPATGGSMENYAQTASEKEWREEVLATLDAVKHGWQLITWSKGTGGAESRAYRLFAYATFLMAWEPDAQLWFGGQWGGPHQAPDNFFYHQLGRPLEHFATTGRRCAAGDSRCFQAALRAWARAGKRGNEASSGSCA